MFRAKVEAVSGLKVFARGKWLTCIGNRPVKVGDIIWTDGRCVYGNDLEAQTPFVFTPKEEFGIGIPILSSTDFYTFLSNHKKLKHESEAYFKRNYSHCLINDFFKNAYIDEYKNNYWSPGDRILSANINKDGDIYTLSREFKPYVLPKGQYVTDLSDAHSFVKVNIRKNGKVIHSVDNSFMLGAICAEANIFCCEMMTSGYFAMPGTIRHYWDTDFQEIREVYYIGDTQPREYGCFIQQYVQTDCEWGFIEDANNWAFITSTYAVQGGLVDLINEPLDYLAEKVLNIEGELWGYATGVSMKTFYYDNNGTKLIFSSTFKSREYGDTDGTYPAQYHEISTNNNVTNATGLTIPLQDDFYLKINSVIAPPSGIIELPLVANATICDSNHNEILTENFWLGSFITIHKLKNNFHLIGLDLRNGLGLDNINYGRIYIPDIFSSYRNNLKFLSNGLYLCKDNTLQQVGNFAVKNHKLRPMKNFKNWWNRIQNLT